MTETDQTRKLAELDARIAAAKKAQAPKPRMDEHYSQAEHAWRMVVELVAGLGVGFLMGYGLDTVLGTTPWLMIVFVFLGFAAGVKSMLRSAREMQEKHAAKAAQDGFKAPGADDERT